MEDMIRKIIVFEGASKDEAKKKILGYLDIIDEKIYPSEIAEQLHIDYNLCVVIIEELLKEEEIEFVEENDNMRTYKKLIIKSKDETEELDINDIKSLKRFHDIHFHDDPLGENHAIIFSYFENELKHKVAKLSKKADWIIREYEGELYLIPLKKDC